MGKKRKSRSAGPASRTASAKSVDVKSSQPKDGTKSRGGNAPQSTAKAGKHVEGYGVERRGAEGKQPTRYQPPPPQKKPIVLAAVALVWVAFLVFLAAAAIIG